MRTRRLWTCALMVIVAVAAIAGCQVSTNDEPVAVGPIFDDLLEPTTTTSPTTTPDGATRQVTVYFLRSTDTGDRLAGVLREVAVDAGPAQILTNLFDVRPDATKSAEERELTSAIPASAELLSTQVRPGSVPGTTELVVDTRGLFGAQGPVGPSSRDAVAQIVYTATGVDDIREVRFLNEGEEVPVLIGTGETAERAVNRQDYRNLAS